ncbi:YdbH domain-containing protein [Phenylobacterium sp.]|uniref:intermembrane phospholipid transport protein YdbH family protein n=1 Tax=Phenylobacterium sp. TaxID=1871053 RepID=UPI0025F4C202|nr:YdbH domain-containing protein [Phenylobacterium sp.]
MPDPKPAKARCLRVVLAIAGLVLIVAAGFAWLNRKALARDALTGWLKSKGVAAQARVDAVGPTTFVARLTLGDPRHPDFTAERAEIHYRIGLGGLTLTSVTLKQPVLRASLHDGKLGLGALDPLVRDFLSRPPPPNFKLPAIHIDGGVLVLSTDYGPMRLNGDVRVDDGQLQQLTATSAPTRLKGAALDITLGQGSLRETARGSRVNLSLDAPASHVAAGGASAKDARLRIDLEAPYPDLVKHRGDGALLARVELAGRQVAMGGRSFGQAGLSGVFTGRSTGWMSGLAVTGRATGDLRADGGSLGGARLGRLRAALLAEDVRWTRVGGDRVSAKVEVAGSADGVEAGGLSVDRLAAKMSGPLSAARNDVRLSVAGSVEGHGRWTGLGAPLAGDAAQVAAVKRAAHGFRFAAPAISAQLALAKAQTFTAKLLRPVSLRPDTGGEVRLAQDGGGLTLTVAGGGLPQVEATVRSWTLGAETTADLAVKAQVSAGLARDAQLDAAGRLRIAGGATTFTASRCAAFKVAQLDFGANDIEGLSGQLCPADAPLASTGGGDWRLTGRAAGVAAAVPFAQVRLADGAGRVMVGSRRGRLSAVAEVAAARLEDSSPQGRFHPLAVSGRATLADLLWTADFAFRQPKGVPVGRAHLAHDGGLGVGFVTLATDTLTFADGGLQPVQLSPLAGAVGSPATGQARFEGRFDWARVGVSSSGSLSLRNLGFQSPAGRVEGLNGELAFTSLAPLVAAPGQLLNVASVQAIVPLTNLHGTFSLADNVLKIAGGEAEVGGGRIRIESLDLPLAPGAPTRGVLSLEDVQLHDLVEASPFGDKVDLDARVSGRIAFEATGNKVRIGAGELKATRPGRISIDRSALTGMTADTTIAAPAAVANPNDTFTDFAYQAMENLAFDTLEATVASRDDGRLGVLFHIVGRHDPPTKQRIRLTIMDLIQKRFLGRKLPLPSGTGVNLTLDTTLNLDDLLKDYADYRALHGSAAVQPRPFTLQPR